MKGMQLAKQYYETYGKPMLYEKFPALLPHIAVGLVGEGSECFGFDDDVSQDHDFGPDFCIFLPDETQIDRRTAFELERAYAKLPRTFEGFSRPWMNPVGGARRGVCRADAFYQQIVGNPHGITKLTDWFFIPDHALATATNGEVFFDGDGAFSAVRKGLLDMPTDVRKKKLAGTLLLMGQAGQYNYPRCLSHHDPGAAQLAITEFVRQALRACFLLSNRHMPYYKWQFRALQECADFAFLSDTFSFLISSDNNEVFVKTKTELVADTISNMLQHIRNKGWSTLTCNGAEQHAYAINDSIENENIRALHILYGAQEM